MLLRGVSFNDVLYELENKGVIDNYKHPNIDKYPNQYIYVVSLKGYIHYVWYVKNDDYIFLIDNDKIKQMAKETRQYNQEKKQISINLKKSDLDMIKQRADDIGISYQNIIQALIHNYTTNKISINI